MIISIVIPVTGFIIGAILGSWAACTGCRLPRKIPLWGRSRCMSCGQPLSFLDLVPILGYFFVHGHCRYCDSKISASYLVPEITLAFVSMLLFMKIGPTTQFLVYMVLLTGLAVASVSDLETFLIPDAIIMALAIPVIPFIFWTGDVTLWNSVTGGILGFTSMILPGLLINRFPGGGDIKLVAMIGIYLGAYSTAIAFTIGVIICLCIKRFNLKDYEGIPLAPYLFMGVSLLLLMNTWV